MLKLKSYYGKTINIHGDVTTVIGNSGDDYCTVRVNGVELQVSGSADAVSAKIEALIEFSSKQFTCLISPLACIDYLLAIVIKDQYGVKCPGTKIVFASGQTEKVKGTVKSVRKRLNA